MYHMGMSGTQWEIFKSAVELFSRHGYENVPMRVIAEHVGIRAASIYNHFSHKEDLLKKIYSYYGHFIESILPDFDELLLAAETEDPYRVLADVVNVQYPPDTAEIMNQVMLIIGSQMCNDPNAAQTFDTYLIQQARRYLRAVLEKMITLGRIEPLDVESFLLLQNALAYYCAFRINADATVTPKAYAAAHGLLRSIVKVKEQPAG